MLKNTFKPFKLKQLGIAGVMSLAMLAISSLAHANNPPPRLKADAPNRYVVKKGDTLWDISGRYLDNPWDWKRIWAANKQIKNPNLIYPDDILLLCVIQGQTLVGIDTGEGCAGIERNMTATATATAHSVTITPLNNAIPPIPLSAIEYWLDRVLIVNPTDYEHTPYVIASKNRNIITGAGDKIYAKGVPLIVGQRYGIYREGEPFVDPATNQIVGLEVRQVATGTVTAVETNGVSSIELLDSYEYEVREGDRVFVELGNAVPPMFQPSPAVVNRGGMIVRVTDSIGNAAAGSVVAINLGTENGAKPGDVLAISRRGPLVRDVMDNDMPVRLPSEQAGHLMIFKTFNKISYAYVLDAEIPLSVGDRLSPPVAMY